MAAGLGAAACLEAPGGAGDVTITEPSAQFAVTVVAEGLAYPWSLAFLPGGDMLVTERDGHLRLIRDGILQPEPIAGVPEAFVASQGGLFDLLSGATFIALLSFPIMLAGVLAIGYLANQEFLGWFPVSGLSDAAADGFTFLPSVGADGAWQRGWLVDRMWHIDRKSVV